MVIDYVAHAYEYPAGWIRPLVAGQSAKVSSQTVDTLSAQHAQAAAAVTKAAVTEHLRRSRDAISWLVAGLRTEDLAAGTEWSSAWRRLPPGTARAVWPQTCSCYNREPMVRARRSPDWRVMGNPLILYSTNTWLAYKIAQRYYKTEHYVWCTPYFDPRKSGDRDAAVPPTSSPFEVYRSLVEEVTRRDHHSNKIEENRAGILRGANAQRQSGVIDARQEKDIVSIVERADFGDFRPLMYVIPYSEVIDRMREPPPEDKAHPLSEEYIIDRLPRELFDIIEFGDYR